MGTVSMPAELKVTTFILVVLSDFLLLLFVAILTFLFFISTEKLAEANKRADALAQKLEQSEAARKEAELVASEAKAEVDE